MRALDGKHHSSSFLKLYHPAKKILPKTIVLDSKGDKPLKITFEDELKALIFYHLEEHSSSRHLLQILKEDDYAHKHIAPKDGIEKSGFFEAIKSWGLEQLQFVYHSLCREAKIVLLDRYANLGNLVAIDGSVIQAVLSMTWTDYRDHSKKAKIHLGFDINRGIHSNLLSNKIHEKA